MEVEFEIDGDAVRIRKARKAASRGAAFSICTLQHQHLSAPFSTH
jgi:hypothetical protein